MSTSCEEQVDVLVLPARPGSTRGLTRSLTAVGLSVREAADVAAALELLSSHRTPVVVVDVGRPEDAGSLVGRLREAHEPSVVVAAGADERSSVGWLRSGCDVTLAGRDGEAAASAVSAVVRLARRLAAPHHEAVYDDGLVRIDEAQRRVEVAGTPVNLTPLEFRLLGALVAARDRVVSREELLQTIWNSSAPADGDHVKLYVHYLRRKLGEHTGVPLIQTLRGFGYRWLGAHGAREAARFRQHAVTAG